jgi:pyruvate,water dikinase
MQGERAGKNHGGFMSGSRRSRRGSPSEDAAESSDPAERSSSIRALAAAVAAEFDVSMGRSETVQAACDRLLELLREESREEDALAALAPLLRKRSGPIARPLFDLLLVIVRTSSNPWPVLREMLEARDGALALEALEEAVRLADGGRLRVDGKVLRFLAERVEQNGAPLAGPDASGPIAAILARRTGPRGKRRAGTLSAHFLDEDPDVRRLATRLLDAKREPAPAEAARGAIGAEAQAFLAPYLAYTRAGFRDLLALAPRPGGPVPALESIRRAEETCGEALLRDVIAEVGWTRLNLGITVEERIGIEVRGSFPLTVSPAEAELFRNADDTRAVFRLFLIRCHGGGHGRPVGEESGREEEGSDPVARFRAYNLTHAEALAEILDMAPLTEGKVRRILARMDRIVEDFVFLFSRHSEECALLSEVYRDLRGNVLAELAKENTDHHLSAELTRLVQMFEDPRALAEVRTLHGLKRYLHQSGLRLGFRLVETTKATNRTVDLVLASAKRVEQIVRSIQYVDFEEEGRGDDGGADLPYPVRVAADGFGRQMLHGQEKIPEAKIFCYGNEVHYFVAFGNHPAFLRIDYAPPLRGGMIDLEYYGVSKNELDVHPNPSLDGIRRFFLSLEFDVQIESTHIHARFDKERALELGDICEKAEALFRLVPYLMEVDWVIGSLALDNEAKRVVAAAWADSFAIWGVLPFRHILTKDRTGILTAIEPDAAGNREIPWNGEGPYRDQFSAPPPPSLFAALRVSLGGIDEGLLPSLEEAGSRPIGQIRLEELLLRPLRAALRRGEIVETPGGYRPRPREVAERMDEAVRFAEILSGGADAAAGAAAVAALVAPLERMLRFRTTGSVNGYEVQRARLALRGESLGLFVLRDDGGVIRLALFADDTILSRGREDASGPWRENAKSDVAELASLLRRSNYVSPGVDPITEASAGEVDRIVERMRTSSPLRRTPPLPGERILYGLRASPGRAVGTAIFGTENREATASLGAVLFAPSIGPEDNAFLYHAAGIVSTGGGVLSHAGLIAVQFHKPSLVVPGRWVRTESGELRLLYPTLEYREERKDVDGFAVTIRRDVREREQVLREGDLVVLDADEGTLRVLGGGPEALALHDGFRSFADAAAALESAEDEKEVLVLRGRRLRARHQIEKQMRRLTDPVLARHAAREILTGKAPAGSGGESGEKAKLLALLLENPAISETARLHLVEITDEIATRLRSLRAEAMRRIPEASLPYEILSLRLRLLRLQGSLREAVQSLRACGVGAPIGEEGDLGAIDDLVRERLAALREELAGRIEAARGGGAEAAGLRHLVRQAERLDSLLGSPPRVRAPVEKAIEGLLREDERSRSRAREKRILRAGDGGFELHPFFGWKAANLAELERLGSGGSVPPWFVVADRAFREVLDSPPEPSGTEIAGGAAPVSTLRERIDAVLREGDLSHHEKSARIRALWSEAHLPESLAAEVAAAYRELVRESGSGGGEKEHETFVAVRSSAREEDAETAARAGEFDTFLFIRGEEMLLEHLMKAWSGLWTERAIHNRAVLGRGIEETGGGVLVQRIVWSRVSGVLLTVNVAEGQLREMVVNAGLGLGEGIVSGAVAADQIVVDKEGDSEKTPLRFRYITSDKTEQVVYNARAGSGTVRAETLYHQRLRPALEYVELRELARLASRLESAYGYPLDIEFGIEGARLWILQVRPVATFAAALRETIERHPLAAERRSPRGSRLAPPKRKERAS